MKFPHILILLLICTAPLAGMTVTDSLIPYRLDDKWGFADAQGTIRITPKYDSVRIFEGELAVVGINDAFGFVNLSGEEVTNLKYDYVGRYHGELAVVGIDGLFGFVDLGVEEVINLKYDSVTDFDTVNRMIKVTLNGKYQVIDEFGKRIRGNTRWRRPMVYGCVSFGLGYCGAIYEKNGMYGFIEYVCNGNVDSCKKYKEPEFTDYKGFGDYIAAVQKGDKWAIVGFGATGYYISSFEYDEVLIHPTDVFDRNTLTIVVKDKKYGYIDYKGKVVIEPKYEKAHFFEKNGLAIVSHNGRWGYINLNGLEYFQDK